MLQAGYFRYKPVTAHSHTVSVDYIKDLLKFFFFSQLTQKRRWTVQTKSILNLLHLRAYYTHSLPRFVFIVYCDTSWQTMRIKAQHSK